MDYARNRKYFNKAKGKLFAFGIIVGIVLILAGIGIDEGGAKWIISGVTVLAGTIALIVVVIKGMPSDAEMDQQVLEQAEALNDISLNKHGLTIDRVGKIPPLVLGGYMSVLLGDVAKDLARNAAAVLVPEAQALVETVIGEYDKEKLSGIKFKKGKDGIIRSSIAEHTNFLFSENEVFICKRRFSLIDPGTEESTKEYFYRDIVAITTETHKSGSSVFTIKISGGDTEEIPYDKTFDIQPAITAFRQLIRDKKNV